MDFDLTSDTHSPQPFIFMVMTPKGDDELLFLRAKPITLLGDCTGFQSKAFIFITILKMMCFS